MKLDAAWGYRVLRQDFPFLARLADKGKFEELVSIVMSGGAERRVEALIEKDQQSFGVLPQMLGDSAPAGR
jgi:hypothetical protein